MFSMEYFRECHRSTHSERDKTKRAAANGCDTTRNSTDDAEFASSFEIAVVCHAPRTDAKRNEKAGDEDRTRDIQLGKLTFYR
jgi:hypothetical protein